MYCLILASILSVYIVLESFKRKIRLYLSRRKRFFFKYVIFKILRERETAKIWRHFVFEKKIVYWNERLEKFCTPLDVNGCCKNVNWDIIYQGTAWHFSKTKYAKKGKKITCL